MFKKTTSIALFSCLFCSLYAQPVLIADLQTGPANGFNEYNYTGIQFNGGYLLPANDGQLGEELYQLKNGTLSLLKDINPGTASSEPSQFFLSNGLVYFAAKGSNGTITLWQSDGTDNGTLQVAATAAMPLSYLTMSNNGTFYFQTGGRVAYFDPSTGNAAVPGSSPYGVDFEPEFFSTGAIVCSYGNGIAFVIVSNSQIEFWKADGPNFSKLHTRATPGFFTEVYGLINIGDDFLFTISNSVYPTDNGLYLYRSLDNTTARIVNAADDAHKLTYRIKAFDDTKVIFMDYSNVYATDGTIAGTVVLSTNAPELYGGQPWITAIHNGKMLYEGKPGSFSGFKIMATDGTPAGTSIIITISDSFLSPMAYYKGHVWWASGTSNGFIPGIWHTAIPAFASEKIYSYTSGSPIKSVIPLTLQGNKLYFLSNMGGVGRELYALTVSQSTETVEQAPQTASYRFVKQGDGFWIENSESDPEQIEVLFYQADGRQLKHVSLFTGELAGMEYLPSGLVFCQIRGEKGLVAVKFFKG